MKAELERVLLAAVVFVTYTEIDIHAQPFWTKFDAFPEYYVVWQIALWGMLILLGLATRSLLIPLVLLIITVNGTEDLFYFLLQWQLPPERLPWLDGKIYLGIPYLLYPHIYSQVDSLTIWTNGLFGIFFLSLVCLVDLKLKAAIRNAFNRIIEHIVRLADASL